MKLIALLPLLLFTTCPNDTVDRSAVRNSLNKPVNRKVGLIRESTFEESNALDEWLAEIPNKNSLTRVTFPVKAGNYSAKFLIKKTDVPVFGSYRTELKQGIMPVNAERWYGLSVYLPASFTIDQVPECIFQWHNVPNFGLKETWGNYKFQNPFRLETNNGRFVFVHQYSSIPSDPKSPVGSKSYDLGPYETEVWTDWVVHFKLSYQKGGLFEIWKNGQKVLTINGPNYYNDESGPYFKIGIYKWGWSGKNSSTTNHRIVYFDEIREGDQRSSYTEVAPNSNSKSK
jgi:hypothetical protein